MGAGYIKALRTTPIVSSAQHSRGATEESMSGGVEEDEERRRQRKLEEALEVKSLRRIISAYLKYVCPIYYRLRLGFVLNMLSLFLALQLQRSSPPPFLALLCDWSLIIDDWAIQLDVHCGEKFACVFHMTTINISVHIISYLFIYFVFSG